MILKLFRQALILLSPLLLWMAFISVVDPFNMLRVTASIVPDYFKMATLFRSDETMPRDLALYKLEDFQARPNSVVLFGDSRAFAMADVKIKQLTNVDIFNFGIPGGNIATVADTFWFANARTKLKKVYVQVGFHNSGELSELAKGPMAIVKNPLLYYFDGPVVTASFDVMKNVLNPQTSPYPSPSPEALKAWFQQMVKNVEFELKTGVNNQNGFAKLKEIADYCHAHSIELHLINMPMHADVHRTIVDLGLEAEYERFKSFLSSLGPLDDFDLPDVWKFPQEAYSDPLHLKVEFYDRLIQKTWGVH